MNRYAGPILLGWFFMTTYGSVTKADFYTQIACEAGRSDVLAQIGTTNAKKVSPHCREDVREKITAEINGTFVPLPPVTVPGP